MRPEQKWAKSETNYSGQRDTVSTASKMRKERKNEVQQRWRILKRYILVLDPSLKPLTVE